VSEVSGSSETEELLEYGPFRQNVEAVVRTAFICDYPVIKAQPLLEYGHLEDAPRSLAFVRRQLSLLAAGK
jgi:hypothetical protein